MTGGGVVQLPPLDMLRRLVAAERAIADLQAEISILRAQRIRSEPAQLVADTGRIRMADIAEEVAWAHGMTVAQILGRNARREFSWPRQRAYLLCHRQGYSLGQIGRLFGGRDHTTIIHGIRAAEGREQGSPPV